MGSPIRESEKELEKLSKKMKKNNIAVDVINFGEEGINTSKLEKFNSAINNHDNSHLVTVPAGGRMLYEAIATLPILMEEGADLGDSMGGMFGGSGGDIIDPNMDPDLALALRLSLEEEKLRQEREAIEKAKAEEEPKANLEKIEEEKKDEE